jgi:hypothetical protein
MSLEEQSLNLLKKKIDDLFSLVTREQAMFNLSKNVDKSKIQEQLQKYL